MRLLLFDESVRFLFAGLRIRRTRMICTNVDYAVSGFVVPNCITEEGEGQSPGVSVLAQIHRLRLVLRATGRSPLRGGFGGVVETFHRNVSTGGTSLPVTHPTARTLSPARGGRAARPIQKSDFALGFCCGTIGKNFLLCNPLPGRCGLRF